MGNHENSNREMKIDFSSKHNVMVENPDGTLQPMDEPFFQSAQIAKDTWSILSDGDLSYLVAGENEALVIDSGYGCGNIREYCQSLTPIPIHNIANTHYHFDHTANNCYFDCAFLSEETRRLGTIPFPSFGTIKFPRDYPKKVIGEGYVFHLGNRDLETVSIPCHAEGALGFLDRKEKLFFVGDEIYPNVGIHRSVAYFAENVRKILSYRNYFDLICAGGGQFDVSVAEDALQCAEYILSGHAREGEPLPPIPPVAPVSGDPEEKIIYKRRVPRPHDMTKSPDDSFRRKLEYKGYAITYDIRKIELET